MSEFKLENRYMVLKYKHVPEHLQDYVAQTLQFLGLWQPKTMPDCLVVEKDWDCYDEVLELIKKEWEKRNA